jgi:hypothetical protein
MTITYKQNRYTGTTRSPKDIKSDKNPHKKEGASFGQQKTNKTLRQNVSGTIDHRSTIIHGTAPTLPAYVDAYSQPSSNKNSSYIMYLQNGIAASLNPYTAQIVALHHHLGNFQMEQIVRVTNQQVNSHPQLVTVLCWLCEQGERVKAHQVMGQQEITITSNQGYARFLQNTLQFTPDLVDTNKKKFFARFVLIDKETNLVLAFVDSAQFTLENSTNDDLINSLMADEEEESLTKFSSSKFVVQKNQDVLVKDVPLEIQILNKIVHLGTHPNCEWVTVVNELSKAIPALKKPCRRIATTGARRSLVPRPSFIRFPTMKPRRNESIKISKVEPSYGPISGGTLVRLHVNHINIRKLDDLSIYIGKNRLNNVRKITPSMISFYVPSNQRTGVVDVSLTVNDGSHNDHVCLQGGFEYLSLEDYLERKLTEEHSIAPWDNGPREPLTLLNTSSQGADSIQVIRVKVLEQGTNIEANTDSIAANKRYTTAITLNVDSVQHLHLNALQYDFEWQFENTLGTKYQQADLLLSLGQERPLLYKAICDGERRVNILEDGTVMLLLPFTIASEGESFADETEGPFVLKLKQKSTNSISFETTIKRLGHTKAKQSKNHEKLMIEQLYSSQSAKKDQTNSPTFFTNLLGQTELHQCCVTGNLEELSRLRTACDSYMDSFNMLVCSRDHYMRNALHLCFSFGYLELSKFLIYRIGLGTAAELLLQRDYFGMTPFHLAVHYRHNQFLADICCWLALTIFTSPSAEEITVPLVKDKTFKPVIVSNNSPLSVINLFGDDEDSDMVEPEIQPEKKRKANAGLFVVTPKKKKSSLKEQSTPKSKRKRDTAYSANKKIRKESPKLDNIAVM